MKRVIQATGRLTRGFLSTLSNFVGRYELASIGGVNKWSGVPIHQGGLQLYHVSADFHYQIYRYLRPETYQVSERILTK